jgi:hypothetical protein
MKLFFAILAVFIYSCIQKTAPDSGSQLVNDSLKKTLVGKWGGLNESIPIWDIQVDSIYYYDRSKAYSYEIINDDLIINLPGSKGVLKNIFVIKDTVFFLDEQGNQVRGYRFKGNN